MGSRKRPRVPAPTAQEKAFARRSEVALDKEIEEENRRKKLLIRNTLGSGTLLSGIQSGGGLANFSGTSFASRSGGGGGGAPTTTTLGSGGTGFPSGASVQASVSRAFGGGRGSRGSLLSSL